MPCHTYNFTMPQKIAALCTTYYPWSHADVLVTRWLDPHPHDAVVGFRPKTQIAALHVMQMPAGDPPVAEWFKVSPRERIDKYDPSFDISRAVAQTYNVPVFASIREALTLGGTTLAVDAVLLIGEHGDYPENAYGQKLYPRKAMWDAVIAVFKNSGRVVPVFVDKHLSWDTTAAREMVATARALQIPLFAGSSIPITGLPYPLGLPDQPRIAESLGLYYVGAETYGIHSMEFVQSLIEGRAGGESGIVAMTTYAGDAVWDAQANGAWSAALFDDTLAAFPRKRAGDYRANCAASAIQPVACVCEHADGHRQTHVMLDGHIDGFAAGLRLHDDVTSYVTYSDNATDGVFVLNFAHLSREIDTFFVSGVAPVPIERSLLTTLQVATQMRLLTESPGVRVATPDLQIAYSAGTPS
jgi:hypothetical protein